MFGNKMAKMDRCVKKQNPAPVIKLTTSLKRDVALYAVASLGKIGGEEALNALILQLRNPDASMREAAVRALGAMQEGKVKVHLMHMAKTEQDAKVLAAIRETVSSLKNSQ